MSSRSGEPKSAALVRFSISRNDQIDTF
jgi:hypothetical protein